MDSFSNPKNLRFVITLGLKTFSSGNNQITLEGFRASVTISKAGGQQMGELQAQIYGVKQSDINSITTLQWKPGFLIANTVSVYAIDGTQETLVFQGSIVTAWGNYDSAPDVSLQIKAQAAYINRLTPVAPRSYKGAVDVATVMGTIAAAMGYTFENTGVSVQLADVYLHGTALDQAMALKDAAGIDLYLDDTILAITPPNTPRKGLIPEVSGTSGLKGYPTFDGTGVNFTCFFNPSITFGGQVKLTTSILQAAGTWIVTSVAYRLESQKMDGAWFVQVRGNSIGLAISK